MLREEPHFVALNLGPAAASAPDPQPAQTIRRFKWMPNAGWGCFDISSRAETRCSALREALLHIQSPDQVGVDSKSPSYSKPGNVGTLFRRWPPGTSNRRSHPAALLAAMLGSTRTESAVSA